MKSGDALGDCALCLQPAKLRKSHILPELLHRRIYDDNHELEVVRHGAARATTLRKGLRDRLLCDPCERHVNRFEDYFANAWFQHPAVRQPGSEDVVHLVPFDYVRLKLFLLSIVWRASVSRLPDFQDVRLGPHEERVRRMVQHDEPGAASEYPVYAGLIVDQASGRVWDNVLLPPVRIRVDRRWAYRMVFGGASWTVVTSGRGPLRADPLTLKEDGRLFLTVCSWERFARLSGAAAAVQSLPEIPRRRPLAVRSTSPAE